MLRLRNIASDVSCRGTTPSIVVDSVPAPLEMVRRMGANPLVDFTKVDPADEVMRLTEGRAAGLKHRSWR
jgi:threonine dehydrogenase-like Zn-dependent dehydrogenase